MILNENKVKNVNVAYIGGGSRGWAWGLMSDLASQEELSGTVYLYDIDYEAAKCNESIGNSIKGQNYSKSNWNYKVVKSLKEVLKDVDFVIISILPGTFDEMESDVHAPEKYGIYQSVGDSVGPGGQFRAHRTIPMYVEIAENLKKFCPDAWVINYTNPMSLCVRTLYEIFPEIKAFGCCHEVFSTQNLLINALSDIMGVKEAKRSEIKINVLGINHFTWINEAYYKDINLFEVYSKFVSKNYENGFVGNEGGHWMNDTFKSAERVKFDLFLRYGIIAAAGDRHLAEFLPGNWYLKDPKTVENWKFGLTTVKFRKSQLKERLERSERLVSGSEKFELKETGEEGVNIMKALLGVRDLVTNVNMPNYGQVIGLPIGAIVETNAVFTKDSIKPVMAGKLPSNVLGLVHRVVMNQETILTATLAKNKKLAFTAFVNDPLLANISLKDAQVLFNEMFDNTKQYLKGWN
ncbi:alpha-glucosidase/alpha-galactosidase [Clostridium estertheticum]|uniref:family 4 glycosyl hydrolase n=1 Tax=Clostridium estertheticum TaxID=238834 RepID=UPI001C0D119B|nr:alpha-glucosidase/alpha-galactosidase [Clostridium estertheticum]MBU3214405.1 alpha-glucosidase/alpha-galactosidase [Clostridium estertheticum]WAG56390.1 alpha-glucosidase/alpha-galactosidase [Clostridium estertheticum]